MFRYCNIVTCREDSQPSVREWYNAGCEHITLSCLYQCNSCYALEMSVALDTQLIVVIMLSLLYKITTSKINEC